MIAAKCRPFSKPTWLRSASPNLSTKGIPGQPNKRGYVFPMTIHHRDEHQWREERRLAAQAETLASVPPQHRWDMTDEADDLRDRLARALGRVR